jgi:DNA-binding transcriptional LysR family regulator
MLVGQVFAEHAAHFGGEFQGSLNDVLTFRLYTRVARLGSFSAAARECGLTQSQVSRMVAELEASLGARLLTRTTRGRTD